MGQKQRHFFLIHIWLFGISFLRFFIPCLLFRAQLYFGACLTKEQKIQSIRTDENIYFFSCRSLFRAYRFRSAILFVRRKRGCSFPHFRLMVFGGYTIRMRRLRVSEAAEWWYAAHRVGFEKILIAGHRDRLFCLRSYFVRCNYSLIRTN